MPTCSIEQAEAVRRYYAAFPALNKGDECPLRYCLPPPAWCRKSDTNMQSDLMRDWREKKKIPKERRNSVHRKNKKRGCNRSIEKDLPEWVTHEGIWDMESQDPVREFIRAIALDEGYGTAENTVTDEIGVGALEPRVRAVPQFDDGLDLAGEWVIEETPPRPPSPSDEELYAKFEAKFDRSIEALWARDQTPDDECQELPIDFAELLSSPSDNMFSAPLPPARFAPSPLTDSVWSCDAPPSLSSLNLASPAPPELEPFALYEGEELYDAVSTVANTVRSLTAINHSRDTSGFCEVPPRRRVPAPPVPTPPPVRRATPADREDLLTAARTHFRPIERSPEVPRYADGDTFDIRGSPDAVEWKRSGSGEYFAGGRYLACRGEVAPLRFAVRQRDAAVQTEGPCEECECAAKKMRPAGSTVCVVCAGPEPRAQPQLEPDERDWEELLADISAAHAHYAAGAAGAGGEPSVEGGGDRKRRHSAALRCSRHCAHPHARFLPCAALDRPLTR